MGGARRRLCVVLLAAGQGTRMRSRHAKLLHDVAGVPMVRRVAGVVAGLRPERTIAVVGFQSDRVRAALDGTCDAFVLQERQRGTGHAVVRAFDALRGVREGTVLVVNGDLPTLRPTTLRALLGRHRRKKAALTLLSAEIEGPAGYGRVVRRDGRPYRIVEHRDADRATRAIREINVGIYAFEIAALRPALRRLRSDNAQGEYYLTDVVHDLAARDAVVDAVVHRGDVEEILGVNTRAELARAAATLHARKSEALMRAGVTILDPARTRIDPEARVGRDTVIHPDTEIEGACVIGKDCIIRAGCRIARSRIGDGCEIKDHTVVLDSRIGRSSQIGPFAHLRPGNALGADVKIGNFVELKKSTVRDGAKASHLAYLGDADIGTASNIGAGTITCNYDGHAKHATILGRAVFVGSDTQLVAPVRVGDGAYIGAGTTVTQDVPAGALALSRVAQTNVAGWATRRGGKARAGRTGRKDKRR